MMQKVLKWLIVALLVILTLIILSGIYKFNYLASKKGYDIDGNKIIVPTNNKQYNKQHNE